MYWFKQKPYLAICLLTVFAQACKPEVKDNGVAKYFDLKKYFTNEAVRMEKLHPSVLKTVTYNNQTEQKTLAIKNWQRELGLFTESDINKPAWKNSYKVITAGDATVYTAIDTNLRTRKMIILSKANAVKQIEIFNFTKNLLYQTGDHLIYYPDSAYVIEKHQTVKIMGEHNYRITGKLK
jgi:SHS2 domain-containing protein